MIKIPCAIINDLLPLYLDSELSEETQQFVTEHLQQCQKCQACRESLEPGKETLDLSDIAETLPATSTFKGWIGRVRRLVVSGLGVTLLLVILVAIVSFSLGQRSPEGVTVTKVHSDIELQAYIYDNLPGLKRAESLGQVSYPELELFFTDIKADLRVEKLWYTRDMVYVVFSLGGGIIPDYEIDATMRFGDGAYPLTSNAISAGALYDTRFYSVFPLHNQKEIFDPVDDTTTMDFTMRVSLNYQGRRHYSDEKILSVLYDPTWNEPTIMALDGSMPLSEGELIIRSMEITPIQTYLYLDFIHPQGDILKALSGWLTMENGERKYFLGQTEPSDNHAALRISLDALDIIPSNLKLEVERADIISSEQVEFAIDTSSYHAEIEKTEYPQQFLKELRHTNIILEKLYSDKHGISFALLYVSQGRQPEFQSALITDTPYTEAFVEMIEDNYPLYKDHRFANVVSATNEKGESVEIGGGSSGPGERMGMTFLSSFVEASETINVIVSNLSYSITGQWQTDLIVNR